MNKLTDEQLKAEANRLVDKYCPPDALPGEALIDYEARKQREALAQLGKAIQFTSRPNGKI